MPRLEVGGGTAVQAVRLRPTLRTFRAAPAPVRAAVLAAPSRKTVAGVPEAQDTPATAAAVALAAAVLSTSTPTRKLRPALPALVAVVAPRRSAAVVVVVAAATGISKIKTAVISMDLAGAAAAPSLAAVRVA